MNPKAPCADAVPEQAMAISVAIVSAGLWRRGFLRRGEVMYRTHAGVDEVTWYYGQLLAVAAIRTQSGLHRLGGCAAEERRVVADHDQ